MGTVNPRIISPPFVGNVSSAFLYFMLLTPELSLNKNETTNNSLEYDSIEKRLFWSRMWYNLPEKGFAYKLNLVKNSVFSAGSEIEIETRK